MGKSLAIGPKRREASLAERLDRLSLPEPNSGCVLWLGAVTNGGYGIINVDGHTRPATHIALEVAGRPRPSEDSLACHTCDMPPCINEQHLFWGDQVANMADQKAKSRHWATNLTECKNGHSWTAENTRIGKDGRKNCRTCEADRLAHRKATRTARALAA